jgi:hypothetical protein
VILQAREQASFDVRSVRAICPGVPIVLLGQSQKYGLPSGADAYINAAQALTTLAAAVQHIVSNKPETGCPRRCGKGNRS